VILRGRYDGLVDHLLGGVEGQELTTEILEPAQRLGVIVRPRQPLEARSRTAHTSDR
jgi:hypothetical protein